MSTQPVSRSHEPGHVMFVAATPPVLTALVYGLLLLAPDLLGADAQLALLVTGIAEGALLILDSVFIALLALQVGTRERLAIGGFALLALGSGGFLTLFVSPIMGPILCWTVIGHALALAKPGEDRALRIVRGEALCRDAAAQIGLSMILLALGAATFMAHAFVTGSEWEQAPWWRLVGLVGFIHFGVRAASIAHVHRRGFATDSRRLLDQPWLRWMDQGRPTRKPVGRPVERRRYARRG